MPAVPENAADAPLGTSATPTHGVPTLRASGMDREFILQHQIVERYIGGRLPIKGAQDFEHYCRAHPELLDEIALGERINAALRLLESGGRAPPWEQRPQRWWERLPVLLGAAGLCLILAVSVLWSTSRLSAERHKNEALAQQVAAQALDPAKSTRRIAITPSRTAPSQRSAAVIGGGATEFAELFIDMSWSRYTVFNLTIDRVDQGRVAVLHGLQRDSNGNLHLALNSSALGPGEYQLAIEGLTWSGQPTAQAWAAITIAH